MMTFPSCELKWFGQKLHRLLANLCAARGVCEISICDAGVAGSFFYFCLYTNTSSYSHAYTHSHTHTLFAFLSPAIPCYTLSPQHNDDLIGYALVTRCFLDHTQRVLRWGGVAWSGLGACTTCAKVSPLCAAFHFPRICVFHGKCVPLLSVAFPSLVACWSGTKWSIPRLDLSV